MSRVAELPALDPVTPKELAHAAGLSSRTILERMHLWERKPRDPLAIPYLKHLGKPYKIPRAVAERLLRIEAEAVA